MIDSAVFSSAKADYVNENVEKKISRHLFLFCNYNPDSIKLHSSDAIFVMASLNLYKLLVDSSVCNYFKKIYNNNELKDEKNRLEDIIEKSSCIRTLFSHNCDFRNGDDESRAFFEKWCSKIIQKKEPQSLDDYDKLCDEIKKYGDESIAIINRIVDGCARSKDKDQIIKNWEKQIIQFYRRPNSRNIIEAQLKNSYISRSGKTQGVDRYSLAAWVKKMYLNDQNQINSLIVISHNNQLSSQTLSNINLKIRELKEKIEKINNLIGKHARKEIDNLSFYDYFDYYMYSIPVKIEERIKNDKETSLLPQVIIQTIIEEDFEDVSIN